MAITTLVEKIKTGKLYQGTFRASRENYLEGYVNVDGLDDPVSKATQEKHFITFHPNQI